MLVVITLILWCPPSSPPLQQSSDSHCTVLYTLYITPPYSVQSAAVHVSL